MRKKEDDDECEGEEGDEVEAGKEERRRRRKFVLDLIKFAHHLIAKYVFLFCFFVFGFLFHSIYFFHST